jgi:maltose O-acetyltransferase
LFGLKAWLYRWSGLNVHRACRIVSSARFVGPFALEAGADTHIGHDVMIIGGSSRIRIGDCVDIAPRVLIVSGTHEIDMTGSHSAGVGVSKNITIEDGVWIGAHATILGGVTIGKKAIIGAGSVVSRDIPPYVVAVGNPCKPIKRWDVATRSWEALT